MSRCLPVCRLDEERRGRCVVVPSIDARQVSLPVCIGVTEDAIYAGLLLIHVRKDIFWDLSTQLGFMLEAHTFCRPTHFN